MNEYTITVNAPGNYGLSAGLTAHSERSTRWTLRKQKDTDIFTVTIDGEETVVRWQYDKPVKKEGFNKAAILLEELDRVLWLEKQNYEWLKHLPKHGDEIREALNSGKTLSFITTEKN